MISIAVKNLRHGRHTTRLIDRVPLHRVGYSAIRYRGCLYRLRRNGQPFINLDEPITCRGELIEIPSGKHLREACRDAKFEFKVARRERRRPDAAWHLAYARRLRCGWLRELRM